VLRAQLVFDSRLVTIERIDHPPNEPHVDPDEEVSGHYSINLLERGGFSVRQGRQQWTIGATELFITAPGQIYQYAHLDEGHPPTDVCLAVCFKGEARDEIDGLRIDALERQMPVVPIDNRRAYLRRRLFIHLKNGANRLAIESITGELLIGTVADAGRHLYKPSQLEWYARRIDEVRRTLDEDYGCDHTLSRLAADAGMSPYHFARVFRELAGLPPHRYLVRRRLRAAAAQLRAGARVTDACYAVGFQSLSHFIHAFRGAFGVAPSHFRPSRLSALRSSASQPPRGAYGDDDHEERRREDRGEPRVEDEQLHDNRADHRRRQDRRAQK